jgi:aspartate kinase
MVVQKFGGTSVADPDAIRRLIQIARTARERDGRGPVLVVSAMSGVTDALLGVAARAGDAHVDDAIGRLGPLRARHLAAISAVAGNSKGHEVAAYTNAHFDELEAIARALGVLRELSPRTLDAVASIGELLSSRLVAAALEEAGLPAVWVDARRAIVTDDDHTRAVPLMRETSTVLRALVTPLVEQGRVPVLGGFIGATRDGITTTLGRGGSDYSGAIVGAGIDAREIQIWTDVDGMLTADPRIIPNPRLVPQLSFAEASELAYFGAKVLHPSTILPAVARNIPVRILNSRRPENEGTLITADRRGTEGLLTAIACKRDITVIDITSTRMLMAHGFLRRLFEVFERFKTAVDVVTTSEVSVSVTVDDTRRLDAIVDNLRNFAEVSCEPEMAIVSAVGENLRTDPTLFARAVTSLERIPLRLVSQAAGRRNVTFVLRNADVPQAMMKLHETFFEQLSPTVGIQN